jgi:hypothetical protein
MRASLRVAPALSSIGLVITLASVAWWWITFGEVVGYGYLSWREAGGCLVQNSDICSLAETLCLGSHPRILVAYWTSAFWLGAIVFSSSLLIPERVRTTQ